MLMVKYLTEKKDIIEGLVEGEYTKLVIVPQVSKSVQNFDAIVSALHGGKQWVLKAGIAKNTVYTIVRKIKEKTDVKNVVFGVTKNTIKGKSVEQFVLFVPKPTETVKPTS